MTVYADQAATTKISSAARAAMLDAMELYGNPSSLYILGQQASGALGEARESIARCLGVSPREIYFTSGGSEGDNQAILSGAENGRLQGKRHIVTSAFEHHAVLRTMEALERRGLQVTYLRPDSDGLITPEAVADALRPDTGLVSVMMVNNEIGTIQPISEIGRICRAREIPFHTDAVQAVGHIPVNIGRENVDFLTLSAHKFHGPRGIGVLYARRGMRLHSLIHGGSQERGKRAGTENLPAIAGMAAALAEETAPENDHSAQVTAMRDRLIAGLLEIPGTRLNGNPAHMAPGIVNVCFAGIEGESLLLLLDGAGICASSGSACASGSLEPSHVLLSMGVPAELARGSLRLSLDHTNTMDEVGYLLETIPPIVRRLRDMRG